MTLNLLESSSLTAARFKTTRHRMRYIVLKLLLTQGQLETWKGNNSYHSIASKAFNYDSIQGKLHLQNLHGLRHLSFIYFI